MTAPEIRRCGRCGAPIRFLANQNTGRSSPIDLDPVPGGNIAVDLEAGTYRVVSVRDRGELGELHTTHFASCPFADQFRRSG